MKNKRLPIWVLILLPLFSIAQERGYTVDFPVNTSIGTLNNVKEIYLLGFKVSPGYSFNDKFSLSGECLLDMALFGDSKYVTGDALGVAAQYAFYATKKGAFFIRLAGGHSIFADKWKYYYLDGGLIYRIGRLRYAPIIGIGIKWFGSSTTYFTSPCSIYLSIGFRIN